MAGIYAIKCLKNNKTYIGAVGAENKTFETRFNEHKRLLNENRHYNTGLQNDWKLYGGDNFFFEIMEYIDNIELLPLVEKDYILVLIKTNLCYNENLNTEFSCFSHTNETKELISKSNKGKTLGLPHSKKRNEKTSNTLKEKYKNGTLINPMTNKTHTEKTRQKMREAKLKYTLEDALTVKKLLLENKKIVDIIKTTKFQRRFISDIKNNKSRFSIELNGGLKEWMK